MKRATAARAKKPAPKKRDFAAVFSRLKKILSAHAKGLRVTHDKPGLYYVDTNMDYKKKPIMFGAVRSGKAYVSFHLFPLYVFPDLLRGVSPALKERMQGKACLNFTDIGDGLFEELAALTKRGLEAFERRKMPLS